MPGALAQSNVVANMLFGAISGSGAAAAAAMGGTVVRSDRWKKRKDMIRFTVPV